MLRLFHKDHGSGFRNTCCRIFCGKRGQAKPCFLIWGILFICSALLLGGCSPLETAFDGVEKGVISAMIGTPKEVTSVSEDRLAYQQLSGHEQVLYDQMLDCILKQEEEVPLSTVDAKECDKAFSAVMADYGGLFWVDGYAYKTYRRGDDVVGITFSPKYTMTKEERDICQTRVDEVVETWLSEVPADADDYAKSKFVFETLIERVDYDTSAENNQNILSVFLGGATVCRGYASATSYLLDILGVPSTIVSGHANNEAHAWNLVQLDGEYYFLDTTWGNSRYTDAAATTVKHVNYAYLNVTSEELSSNHTIESTFFVPDCTATADNYYYHEGLYFEAFDIPAIGGIFSEGYYGGADASSVKMANSSLYAQMKEYFITEGHITDYCNGLKSVTYLESEETCVLSIEW